LSLLDVILQMSCTLLLYKSFPDSGFPSHNLLKCHLMVRSSQPSDNWNRVYVLQKWWWGQLEISLLKMWCVCAQVIWGNNNSLSAVANAHVWICEKMAHEIMWHFWVMAIFIMYIIFPMWYFSSSPRWTSLLEIHIMIIHHQCIISSKCIDVISFNCLNLTYTILMSSTLGQSRYWSSFLSPLKVIHVIQLIHMTNRIWMVNLIYEPSFIYCQILSIWSIQYVMISWRNWKPFSDKGLRG
jgi:hypothetical protein